MRCATMRPRAARRAATFGMSACRLYDSLPCNSKTIPGFEQLKAFSGYGVRRAKAALSSGCKPHPATDPAGSNRSSHGGNEVAEAFD